MQPRQELRLLSSRNRLMSCRCSREDPGQWSRDLQTCLPRHDSKTQTARFTGVMAAGLIWPPSFGIHQKGRHQRKSTVNFSGVGTCWVRPASEAVPWHITLFPVFIYCICWKGTFICPLCQDTTTTTKITIEKRCLGANSLYSYVFYYCVRSALSRLQSFLFAPNGFFSLRGTRKGSR